MKIILRENSIVNSLEFHIKMNCISEILKQSFT